MNSLSVMTAAIALLAAGVLGLADEKADQKKPAPWATRDIRAGVVGCDTSHVVAFTRVFASHPRWRVRVVAAFPEVSRDMPNASVKRMPGFVKTLREKHGVKVVADMAELMKLVDVVLVESVDGRPHLRQARAAFEAGKPVFIDKPFTAGLADAREILRLSKKTGVPFFSSSCVRFQPEVAKFRTDPGVGKLTKAQGSSPLHVEPHHPDLFWYGIHGVEALYTVMGTGCVSVRHEVGKGQERTIGTWRDGRIGIFRGVKKGDYKPLVRVWGTKGQAESKGGYNYTGLCEAIAKFFHTGKAPIDPAETLEIIEFMTAAQLSKERGGAEVKLEEVRKPTKRPGKGKSRS